MGVVQIVFVLVNLAVPGWLYFRSSDNPNKPHIQWGAFENHLESIVKSSGGFAPCDDDQVVVYIRQLCETSMDRWTDLDSVIVERAAPHVVFSCEVRLGETYVQWRLEDTPDPDIQCGVENRIASVEPSPAFVFSREGELTDIEFSSRQGDRQTVPVKNCRRKLQLALKRRSKRLLRLKSDPMDFSTANSMCYNYDVADGWDRLRGSK
ncbi:MAG: hypothetical protein AB7F86_11205 [Bdellovibrionales bacterium]